MISIKQSSTRPILVVENWNGSSHLQVTDNSHKTESLQELWVCVCEPHPAQCSTAREDDKGRSREKCLSELRVWATPMPSAAVGVAHRLHKRANSSVAFMELIGTQTRPQLALQAEDKQWQQPMKMFHTRVDP